MPGSQALYIGCGPVRVNGNLLPVRHKPLMYLIPVQHLCLTAEGVGHSHVHIAVPGIPGRCQRGIVAADGRSLVAAQRVQV